MSDTENEDLLQQARRLGRFDELANRLSELFEARARLLEILTRTHSEWREMYGADEGLEEWIDSRLEARERELAMYDAVLERHEPAIREMLADLDRQYDALRTTQSAPIVTALDAMKRHAATPEQCSTACLDARVLASAINALRRWAPLQREERRTRLPNGLESVTWFDPSYDHARAVLDDLRVRGALYTHGPRKAADLAIALFRGDVAQRTVERERSRAERNDFRLKK